jgi:hypothetical protein
MTFWDRLVHRSPNFPGTRNKLGYGIITLQSTDYAAPGDRSTDLNTFNQSSDSIGHVQYKPVPELLIPTIDRMCCRSLSQLAEAHLIGRNSQATTQER